MVVIGAGNPAAMLNLTKQCRAQQIPFVSDTSQQLASLDGGQIKELVAGAAYLFCNDYEASLIEHKTGWSDAELTAEVGVRVTTLGADGARVDQAGQEPVLVGPVKDVSPADPTGAGDAFRAGFLAGVAWGLSLERAAQLGNLVAVHALETTGTQEYKLVPAELVSRCAASYGQAAADDIAAHLARRQRRSVVAAAVGVAAGRDSVIAMLAAIASGYHGPPQLTFARAFSSWTVDPWSLTVIIVAGVLYLVGARRIRRDGAALAGRPRHLVLRPRARVRRDRDDVVRRRLPAGPVLHAVGPDDPAAAGRTAVPGPRAAADADHRHRAEARPVARLRRSRAGAARLATFPAITTFVLVAYAVPDLLHAVVRGWLPVRPGRPGRPSSR